MPRYSTPEVAQTAFPSLRGGAANEAIQSFCHGYRVWIASLSLAMTLLASPALAHPGDHVGMAARELFEHLFETDHLIFAALCIATGIFAYRAGKRAEARKAEARATRKTIP